jgi:hypothetical protein
VPASGPRLLVARAVSPVTASALRAQAARPVSRASRLSDRGTPGKGAAASLPIAAIDHNVLGRRPHLPPRRSASFLYPFKVDTYFKMFEYQGNANPREPNAGANGERLRTMPSHRRLSIVTVQRYIDRYIAT